MPPTLDISVPSAHTEPSPSPHTVYTVSIHLPLRSYTLDKRFSDFTALHSTLTTQASAPPPTALPPKHYFASTLTNATLTESRRRGLEAYLQTLASAATDPRWRATSGWRAFLQLGAPGAGGTASGARAEPSAWLDTHRELVGQLQSARERLAARNGAGSGDPRQLAEEGAAAKKALVRAGALIEALERGLRDVGADYGSERMGEGEVRRRRDLVAAARRERERLEELQVLVGRKEGVDGEV